MADINQPNVIILGGGPAGYSAAIRAAQLGADVLLVEKDRMGGTCLNRGCIPTKFLWEALRLEKKIRRAADYGLAAEAKPVSFSDIQQKKNRMVDLRVKGLRRLVESYGVKILEGAARFSGPGEIEVTGPDGVNRFTGSKILIAAGSRPSSIPGVTVDHAKFIDSDDALNLAEVPKSLLVIGGGAIGIELSAIFAALGSSVRIVEREAQLLPREDAELAAEVKKTLERGGVAVRTGEGYAPGDAESFEKVLVAPGRISNADMLDLEKAGIVHTHKTISINEYCETTRSGVYAAGDVTGASLLAYTAQAQGIAAAENMLGGNSTVDLSSIPRVVYSNPPAASAGLAESDLPADRIMVGRFPFAASARASIEGERIGWVKIIADKASDVIRGGHIVGPDASELITVLSVAIKRKLTLHDLSRELFFHPSLAETIHGAAEDALEKSVELPKHKH